MRTIMKHSYDIESIMELLRTNSINDIMIFQTQKSSEVISVISDKFYLFKYQVRSNMLDRHSEEITEEQAYSLMNKRLNRKRAAAGYSGKKISGQLVSELNNRVKQMQGNMKNTRKMYALTPKYQSPNQIILTGFETPFEKMLNPKNRWIRNS